MIDITDIIKRNARLNEPWSVNLFFPCIEILNGDGLKVSFWDGEENWASILHNDVTIGYVWRRYPLVFIAAEYEDRVNTRLSEYQFLSVVVVETLQKIELSIDRNKLGDMIDLFFDKEYFSAEDFWFNTNSI